MTVATEIPRWRFLLALAALFLSSMCTMGDLVISPVAANVYTEFSDAPLWLVNLGITGPALVGLPFGLVTGMMCDRMDKKLIMVAGFAVFTLASVFGIACVDVCYFVAMRLLATGVGWGITNTAALSILADLFPDESEHGKFVGWYNAAMSLVGAALALVAGQLALGGWTCAYQTYLTAVPVLAMLVAFLPAFPPSRKAESTPGGRTCASDASSHCEAHANSGQSKCASTAEQVEEVYGRSTSSAAAIAHSLFISDDDAKPPAGWWRRLVPLSIQVFFVATLYFILLYMLALYVADAGIGDEAYVGALTSVMTLSAAAGSVVFGFFYERLRNFVCVPALVVLGGVFFVLAFVPHPAVVSVTLGIAGFMWPFYFCFFYTHCTEIVPVERQSTATSVVATANGLAMTASSNVLTGAIALTGGTCLTVYPLFGGVMLAVAALSLAYLAKARRQA